MGQQPRGDQQSILKGNDILQDSKMIKMSAVPHYSTLTRQGQHKGAGSGGEGVVAVGWRIFLLTHTYDTVIQSPECTEQYAPHIEAIHSYSFSA